MEAAGSLVIRCILIGTGAAAITAVLGTAVVVAVAYGALPYDGVGNRVGSVGIYAGVPIVFALGGFLLGVVAAVRTARR